MEFVKKFAKLFWRYNGYLVLTGEVNVKALSKSANGCGPDGTSDVDNKYSSTHWVLALSQMDFPTLTE